MDFGSAFAEINAFGGVDYAPHNKGVKPIFFTEAVHDLAASEREGRAVYVDKERVRIHIVGEDTAATHPVDEAIKARFREHYDAWKRKESGAHITGMPLAKWPMATPAMIRELEMLHIYSVEDLAAVSDTNVHNLTNGRANREQAIAWLRSASDGPATAMKYAAEAQRLRDEVAELKKLILAAGIDGQKAARIPLASAEVRKFETSHSKENEGRERAVKPPRKEKSNARKAAWTPERREAAAAAARARGFGRKKESRDEDEKQELGAHPAF